MVERIKMTTTLIDQNVIDANNAKNQAALEADYQALAEKLSRNDIDIEAITRKASEFAVALPSWGLGTGGTRFARFPGIGEPRNIYEKNCRLRGSQSVGTGHT